MDFRLPCFLKANTSGHKTEVGAVAKCENVDEAKKAFRNLKKKFGEVILQENSDGVEMIVGLKEDAAFGKVVVVGFGGIFAEVKKDVVFRALPVLRRDVVAMTKELSEFGVFSARGKKYNLEKFYTLVEKVAYLGEKFNIKELDLNPVMVGEKNVRIVDVRVELE